MKTLAELKRESNAGKLSMEMVEWYGKINDDIPERLRGIRKVKRSNSVAIILLNNDGKESELRINSAKLIDYDGKSLVIYEAGEREPNEMEKAILNKWRDIESEYVKNNPYGETYWKMKHYFANSSCPYMSGFDSDKCKGKYYQMHNGKVRDNSIKGDVIIKYKVYTE